MKVIAINGSPKKEGNTFHALRLVGEELIAQGIEFEMLHVGNRMIHGCTACRKCAETMDLRCSGVPNDDFNKINQQIYEADGILLGSPVYYAGIAGTMKSFLDRLYYVSGANGGLFRQKVGAAVIAVRRSGGSSTFDCLNHYLNISEMIIATSNYWNVIHGREPGEALQDAEGVQCMQVLGRNMAWLLQMKEATKDSIPPPEKTPKVVTHFIR